MIKMHCNLCDRVIPVEEKTGDHFQIVIKENKFHVCWGWDTKRIDVCRICMTRITKEVT